MTASTCCRRRQHGFFEMAHSSGRSSYFHPREWEDQERLDPESYYRELRQVFRQNLPRYFNGHQRVAMSLTGGLDTRMVMAWQKSQPASLPCYTFGGMLRDCQDVVVAREVARACEQPHQVIGAGEELLSRFPHYAERAVYLTDGCVECGPYPRSVPTRKGARNRPSPDDGTLWRVKSCVELAPSSRRNLHPDCFLRSFSATSVRRRKPIPTPFKDTQFPSPLSGRRLGIITAFWRWRRRNFPCGLRFSITTWSERCFARRSQRSGAAASPYG